MKKLLCLPLFLLIFFGTTYAQDAASLVGKWSGAFPGQEGQLVPFTLTIDADTYQLDFGNDGKVDINGEYSEKDGQITIWDVAGENICPAEQKGVYRYTFDGDTLTFTKVSDACPNRGDEPMVVRKM